MKALKFRKIMAILLMAIGVAMFARGLNFSISRDLGWQGAVPTVIVAALVFALGFTRWRSMHYR
jgi:hypothetical protein